jgi:predicted N-acetyltransferase YhbS
MEINTLLRVTVRPATPNDHASIRAVLRAAYAQFAGALPKDVFDEYLADLLDLDRHARHGRLLIAEAAGRAVGSGAFYTDASVQGVGWPKGWAGGRGLAVHPDARGLGVGRALVAECERLARAAGSPVFAFHTASFMSAAVQLYEHLGYLRAPEYDLELADHFGNGGAPSTRVLAYRRELVELEPAG